VQLKELDEGEEEVFEEDYEASLDDLPPLSARQVQHLNDAYLAGRGKMQVRASCCCCCCCFETLVFCAIGRRLILSAHHRKRHCPSHAQSPLNPGIQPTVALEPQLQNSACQSSSR
jgi:hypothetical protein